MCGIFGYLNYGVPRTRRELIEILIGGLKRLEYRGYDSAGIAVDGDNNDSLVIRQTGNVSKLEEKVASQPINWKRQFSHHTGIAHTRWATHGEVSERNSHPQSSEHGEFIVVHNGIVTNWSQLKEMLTKHGHKFSSDTDTEVVAQLLLFFYNMYGGTKQVSFRKLVTNVAHQLEGAYALVVKSRLYPGEICALKRGSPLVVGIKADHQVESHVLVNLDNAKLEKVLGENPSAPDLVDSPMTKRDDIFRAEYFIASDLPAIVPHTNKVLYLEDHDIVHFRDGSFTFYRHASANSELRSPGDEKIGRQIESVAMELNEISKRGFAHFMLKEIFEQPETVFNTMRGRVISGDRMVYCGGLRNHITSIKRCRRLVFCACGTSYHAAMATRQLVEELSDLPVSVEVASDFQDRKVPIFRDDTCVFISQSGETADTRECLEYCLARGAFCVGITNTVGSHIARLTDCGIHLNAGQEVGVASTKAYTSQIVAIAMFALMLGDDRLSMAERRMEVIDALISLPVKIRQVLAAENLIKELALELRDHKHLLIMGRGYQYATAMEAALKIKEICYIHTEAIQAGELKHGPLALIDETMPVIFVATQDRLYSKVCVSFKQVTARGGRPIAIVNPGDTEIAPFASRTIVVPKTIDCLQGILNIIPMQLLAYHIALLRGLSIDQPRNLAKSVTTG